MTSFDANNISDKDLIDFGWAPGEYYVATCLDCGRKPFEKRESSDKRSIRCRPCAVERFRKANSFSKQCDVSVEVESDKPNLVLGRKKMKAKNLTKANIGDTITMRGEVMDAEDSFGFHPILFKPSSACASVWLHFNDEVEIVESRFKPGDEVSWDGDQCVIIAVDDDEAWVRRVWDRKRLPVKTSSLRKVQS